MSTGGGAGEEPDARPEGPRAGSEAPPWEQPDLPSWWTSATGPAIPPPVPSPARLPRGVLVAVVAVVAVVLAGGGTLVALRRGEPSVPAGGTTNAFGSAGPPTTQGSGPRSSTGGPATTAGGPQTEAQIRARLDWIQRQLARVRGLDFERPVTSELLSAGRLNDRVLKQVDAETDEDRLRAEGRALVLLGQVPAGTDLVELMRSVQVESVLGYYVPGKGEGRGRLYVRAEGGLTPFAEFLLSHEFTHALADQHFDLTNADRLAAAGRDEALLGYLALVEGDATYTMQRYYQQEMSPAEQLAVARGSVSARTPVLDRTPAVVRRSLGFPYQAGLLFVQALHQRGGWAAVNRAYADPPVSSEQILHPEKYLAPRDDPQQVDVPDLRRALGRGWRNGIDVDWGEADARFLLTEQLPVTAAKDAAAGWDGGQLRTFEQGGRTALALRTVWDTPAEATEFCQTMGRWATARIGRATGSARWAGAGQHAALLCAGNRATWLSAPDSSTLGRMRGGLGGKP